ncbi:MAG: MarR family transcriptional regulator [Acidobacteria bacterium]|nr:MarR family transcriptional regulator [Acidobacteriota bacterium]
MNGLEIYRALSELARRYQFRNREEVCCYGLTVSQCYALEALSREGILATSELAERLGLDLSSTTRIVDQLVRKKLAIRRRGASDARVREIATTDAGRRLVNRLDEDFGHIIAHALDGVPAPVIKALPGIVRRLISALSPGGAMPCGCFTTDARAEGTKPD